MPTLTDTAIRKAKPRSKPWFLYDTGGLYIEIAVSGSKLWRQKYRLAGKERRQALGAYPDVTLLMARDRAQRARTLVADGIDPLAHKAAVAAEKAAQDTFEAVAMEYIAVKLRPTQAASHVDRVEARFKRDIFPYIGARKLPEITTPELLAVLRRIEGRGVIETAHRALQTISQTFRYGIATGRATTDPSRDLRGALTPVKKKHFPAPLDPKRIGEILLALDGYRGTPVVQAALKLGGLVFVRPGELRRAQWADIDFDDRQWAFHVTKTKVDHIVPLSIQALTVLEAIRSLTGHGQFVFPSARSPKGDRPMSDNAVLMALRTLGIGADEMVGHSWRACARTLLDETLGYPAHIIEHQLAHAVRDPHGTAYNRTKHLSERRAMLQAWAEHLDKLRLLAKPRESVMGNVVAIRE
jgi:integrase